jgi:hypothetical protein
VPEDRCPYHSILLTPPAQPSSAEHILPGDKYAKEDKVPACFEAARNCGVTMKKDTRGLLPRNQVVSRRRGF